MRTAYRFPRSPDGRTNRIRSTALISGPRNVHKSEGPTALGTATMHTARVLRMAAVSGTRVSRKTRKTPEQEDIAVPVVKGRSSIGSSATLETVTWYICTFCCKKAGKQGELQPKRRRHDADVAPIGIITNLPSAFINGQNVFNSTNRRREHRGSICIESACSAAFDHRGFWACDRGN